MGKELRICVTGLSRAGKTAFITALVDALHNARTAPQAFAAWKAAADGRLRGAMVIPPGGALGGIEAFPFFDNARHIRSDPPEWPAATEKPRALTVRVARAWPRGVGGKVLDKLLGRREAETITTTTLSIVDYPGEWVMDVPMLAMSYADWSGATLSAMAKGPRQAASVAFRAALERIDPAAPYDDQRAIAAHEAYVGYLEACRLEHHLSLLQPGRFLRPEAIGGRTGLLAQEPFRFFPLPPSDKASGKGTFQRTLSARFDAYKRDHVDAFFKSLSGPGDTRQVVLFDLLSALSNGEDAYEDAREALAQIAQALRPRQGFLSRLFGGSIKVLYVATKADHVHSCWWTTLEKHVADIVGDLQAARGDGSVKEQVKILPLASISCTADAIDEDGHEAVLGNVRDPKTKAIVLDQTVAYPGPPAGRPTWQQWKALRENEVVGFRFPEFVLDPRQLADRRDLPHIHLDHAIAFLLDDHV